MPASDEGLSRPRDCGLVRMSRLEAAGAFRSIGIRQMERARDRVHSPTPLQIASRWMHAPQAVDVSIINRSRSNLLMTLAWCVTASLSKDVAMAEVSLQRPVGIVALVGQRKGPSQSRGSASRITKIENSLPVLCQFFPFHRTGCRKPSFRRSPPIRPKSASCPQI